MAFEHDPSIFEYQHEKSRPKEAEALHMLRKIASLVKPIMRRRGWKLGVLTEFWPEEKNLLGLNINRGERICLRLRAPFDERQFLPLEQVTDTMLHELCHIVYGPHDEPFHTLWNQLREEHEQLARKGYTGEGFLSKGHKLGGGRIPMHEARRRARAAAEQRKVLSASSGQRLGGAPVRRGQDIRKIIADAASRRAVVTKGCASGTSKERERELMHGTDKNGFRTKAEEDDANEEAIMIAYIDLIQEDEKEKYGKDYVPPSKENPAGSQGARKPGVENPSIRQKPGSYIPPLIPSSSKPKSKSILPEYIDLAAPDSGFGETWTCNVCTLINPSDHLCCGACDAERPSPPSSPAHRPLPSSTQSRPPTLGNSTSKKAVRSLINLDQTMKQQPKKPLGWLCICGNFMEEQWWTCANCGVMKQTS